MKQSLFFGSFLVLSLFSILLARFPRFFDNTRMIKTFHWRVIWAPSIFSSHNEHREEWRYVPFSCFTREAKTFIMPKRKPWIATFLSSRKEMWVLDHFWIISPCRLSSTVFIWIGLRQKMRFFLEFGWLSFGIFWM